MYRFFIFLGLLNLLACQAEQPQKQPVQTLQTDSTNIDSLSISVVEIDTTPELILHDPIPDRTNIKARLQAKIKNKEPLVVHVFVPLCDNENQGIVRTSNPSLGNGMSLKSNLYWATSTGMKKFFKTHKQWTLLDNFLDVDDNVLERVVFKRVYANQATVYLVADAYRGDRMGATVNDYLRALADNYREELTVDSQTISLHGGADFMVFNGHNGLMDIGSAENWTNKGNKETDAAIIACNSSDYFEDYLIRAKAYPLLRCNYLLHPGAYVLSPVIDDWVNNIDDIQLKINAGKAYCERHKCSKKTSRNYFMTGWAVPKPEIIF